MHHVGRGGGASHQPLGLNSSHCRASPFLGALNSRDLQPPCRQGGEGGPIFEPQSRLSQWEGGRGVSPAWNSCGCPYGVLTGNPARPAGHTDTPCKEDKAKELGKEPEKKKQADDWCPAVQAATAAMWRQLWFSQQPQRAEGRATPHPPPLEAWTHPSGLQIPHTVDHVPSTVKYGEHLC